MPLQTVQYIPASRKDVIRQQQVTMIRAVAHERKPWDNSRSTNHWCLYLQTSPTSSVRVDMTPSYSYPSTRLPGGSKGNLIVSELPYVVTNHAKKIVQIRPMQGLRVHHIVDALIQAGRDKYEFDRDGVGCRMWTSNTLSLLQSNGYGNSGQIQEAQAAILKVWPDGTSLELDRGAYY
ncbi:uncharacterized protein Z518_00046 [Rhinocladiella mackenziei CBS 650.93]|uniref:DUF7770 domain-containing protein n=1 Tax=Rhinocladiella mackenziei CBS 650.93 TaxID=1442369 RepID=A0A0D2HEH0_9EURO|nr:uncharacterized protein Z518_00046 [Rhinocladiella mackenziei CBS 650.93]KIX08968.1 hypothetical protein Z518_00046 [Rhinocladiella mackenziei CBS 650.93]